VAVQALGTWLQLSGSVITLGGLLYAWHKASGALTRLRDTAGNWWRQLLSSIDQWASQSLPQGTAEGSFTLRLDPVVGMAAEGVSGEPTSDDIARLQREIIWLRGHVNDLVATLRTGDKQRHQRRA
jgi:hypothetical protein